MALRTRTLPQLLASVRYIADAQGLTLRHSDADLTTILNSAIQQFREKLCVEGGAHYLQAYQVTLPIGATSPYPFAVLDLTSGPAPPCVRVYRVHVTVNNRVFDLQGVEFTEVTRYQDWFRGIRSGVPVAFASWNTQKLALMPPPDQGYTAVVWYLPQLPDLANPGDTFDGVAGWEDWPVYETCLRAITRDTNPAAYQMLTAERDRHWSDIIRSAARVNRAATTRRRDTWAEQRERELYAKYRIV